MEQMTMGDEFATERNLEFALGDGKASFPRLFDVDALVSQRKARERRKEDIEKGQGEFNEGSH